MYTVSPDRRLAQFVAKQAQLKPAPTMSTFASTLTLSTGMVRSKAQFTLRSKVHFSGPVIEVASEQSLGDTVAEPFRRDPDRAGAAPAPCDQARRSRLRPARAAALPECPG